MQYLVTEVKVRLFEAPNIYQMLLGTQARETLLKFYEPSYSKRTRFKIILAAYKAWKIIGNIVSINWIGYYMSFNSKEIFPLFFWDTKMDIWRDKGIRRLGDIYSTGVLVSFSDLVERYKISKNDFFKYLQIRDFINKHCRHSPIITNDLVEALIKRANIGTLYDILQATQRDDIEMHKAK